MDVDTLPSGTGLLPSSFIHNRYLLAGPSASRPHARRSRNHLARSTAKRFSQTSGPGVCREIGFPCLPSDTQCPRCSADLPQAARRRAIEKRILEHQSVVVCDRSPRSRTRWPSEDDEGTELARSAVPLPSDRFRLTRTPSLEREDAFRDASTAKGNVHLRRNNALSVRDEDAEIAELYRMGLLYDDEQDRGSAFDLNSIQHEEPVYTVRPAKRPRKSKARRFSDLDTNRPLYLDLSFTDLCFDRETSQFFPSGPSSDFDEPADDDSVPQSSSSSSSSTRAFAPLRVIYELDGSQPDMDVDTSQPPDLVSDLLSDYDCFSDSDLDDHDAPTQREVRDSAAAPGSEAWVMLGDGS